MAAYLVRHAKAGSREQWARPDRDRPLTPAGRRQAAGLVAVITGVRSIRSSPYVRCVETVEPLAAAAGVEIQVDQRIAEGADPSWVLAALADGDGVVLCTHGDVMASIVIGLIERGVPLDGGRLWQKGATWAFEATQGRIVSGRYLPPPAG